MEFEQHFEEQENKEQEWTSQGVVRELVKRCSRALSNDEKQYYYYVAERMRTLDNHLMSSEKDPWWYSGELDEDDSFYYNELVKWRRNTNDYVQQLNNPETPGSEKVQYQTKGYVDPDTATKNVIEKAFKSYVSIARYESIIPSDLEDEVPVTGFGTQLGVHKQNPTNFTDVEPPIQVKTRDRGTTKTMILGGTGGGKSAYCESEGYDAFASEDPDFSVFDMWGVKGESWCWDIPQHDEDLKEARDELNLPTTFEDSDELPEPGLQIYLPLSNNLDEIELPYDASKDQFEIVPYTIPASEIPKKTFAGITESFLTDAQRKCVTTAYRRVDSTKDDWSLKDLEEEVLQTTGFTEGTREKTVNFLRQIQSMGFIRTKDDPHALDITEVAEQTDVIKSFSPTIIENERVKHLSVIIVTRLLIEKAERGKIPHTMLLFREMRELIPHKKRQKYDAIAASLQEHYVSTFGDLARAGRHGDLSYVCDTQYLNDISKSARSSYNRYVVIDGSREKMTADVAYEKDWLPNVGQFYSSFDSKEVGEAGMACANSEDLDYVAPVQLAPAPTHHWMDQDRDPKHGAYLRAKYHDDITVATPSEIETDWKIIESNPTPEVRNSAKEFDIRTKPVHKYVQERVKPADGEVLKENLYKDYNDFRDQCGAERKELDRSFKTTFTKRLRNAMQTIHDADVESRKTREGRVFVGIELAH